MSKTTINVGDSLLLEHKGVYEFVIVESIEQSTDNLKCVGIKSMQRTGTITPSNVEAARIASETAHTLYDDLQSVAYPGETLPMIERAIALAIERWRVYQRGGELYPSQGKRE